MAIQQESLFETPLAHETSHYSNPYSTPEFEDETSHYSNPYTQPEFEDETSHYSNPYSTPEFEDETSHYSNPYSSPEGEAELESILHSANPEGILGTIGNVLGSILGESEVMHELEAMSNPEFEDEADQFFGKIKRLVKRAGSLLKPLARRFLPIVAKTLGGMIPGVGAIAGPLAGQLVGRLVREAEQEVAQMEQHFANALAQTGELEHPEVHEAMLTELMAA